VTSSSAPGARTVFVRAFAVDVDGRPIVFIPPSVRLLSVALAETARPRVARAPRTVVIVTVPPTFRAPARARTNDEDGRATD